MPATSSAGKKAAVTPSHRRKPSPESDIKLPPESDWRTTDEDEINRRRVRARTEVMTVQNLHEEFPVYSNFLVTSASSLPYEVEIRDVAGRRFHCTCTDFRINSLGTCKHIEAVLLHLEARWKKQWETLRDEGSPRAEIELEPAFETLRISGPIRSLPRRLRALFDASGRLNADWEIEDALQQCLAAPAHLVRVSNAIAPWLQRKRHGEERTTLRREYETGVLNGAHPPHETLLPLYPYQREGMMHLAFTGRAMLADEMGLGKTIQAIAACALLHRLGKARRVLVVTPASLKSEWEEQILKFTTLTHQVIYGSRAARNRAYHQDAPFFTLMNYEQVRTDVLDLNERLQPDIIVLDEAQRIKNWASKTARAVKQLRSRFAFVLTGTPLENRIDELYSLIDFLDPQVFGSLFRFNREFYEFDEKGRPTAYRNLRELHERVRPLMLRRRKADVEDELPGRTDQNRFVPMTEEQQAAYEGPSSQVARLMNLAKRRALRKEEQDKLMRELAKMRMICDSVYILDQKQNACPKLTELRSILEDCFSEPGVKVIIFSEWVKMLDLVRGLLDAMQVGYALHSGQITQQRRRAEIIAFKTDPNCRAILCTESGGAGLNLQNASVVINCDLPWNPAKLEQRIARAWRKHQKRPVTVINLITENSIEHGMLGTLAMKQGLSDGVLDLRGDLDSIDLKGGSQSFLNRLQLVLSARQEAQSKPALPQDPARAFALECRRLLGDHLVACEERYANDQDAGATITVVLDREAATWQSRLQELHQKFLSQGPHQELRHLIVLDEAAASALKAMQAAGLIQRSERAARPLLPSDPAHPEKTSIPESLRASFLETLGLLDEHLKAARVLLQAGLEHACAKTLHETILCAASLLAIRDQLPMPKTEAQALQTPWILCWPPDIRATLLDFQHTNAPLLFHPILSACQQISQIMRELSQSQAETTFPHPVSAPGN